jgi:hypothetical protein
MIYKNSYQLRMIPMRLAPLLLALLVTSAVAQNANTSEQYYVDDLEIYQMFSATCQPSLRVMLAYYDDAFEAFNGNSFNAVLAVFGELIDPAMLMVMNDESGACNLQDVVNLRSLRDQFEGMRSGAICMVRYRDALQNVVNARRTLERYEVISDGVMDIIRQDVRFAYEDLERLAEDGFCEALGPTAESRLLGRALDAVAEISHELEIDNAD